MPQARRGPLERAAALCERMRAAAHRGDWVAVARMQRRCRRLLAAAFEPPPPASMAATLHPILERMAGLHRDVATTAAAAREGLRRRLLHARHGRRALAAYRNGT